MKWHYAAKQFKEPNGDAYYGIVEVYPDLGPNVHTANEITINADSVDKLKEWLQLVIDDLNKYPPIETKRYDIWMEGCSATGEAAPATLYAWDILATSFDEACDIAGKADKNYSPNTKTSWGCKLFDNEADARKNFG